MSIQTQMFRLDLKWIKQLLCIFTYYFNKDQQRFGFSVQTYPVINELNSEVIHPNVVQLKQAQSLAQQTLLYI